MTTSEGPAGAPSIRVLSLGAGVQSTVLALMAASGELPGLDCAVFADTGWEPAAVYQHLDRLEETLSTAGIALHRVSHGNLRNDVLDPHRHATIPAYSLSPAGKRGVIGRRCTGRYKVEPIERHVRLLLGAPTRTVACKYCQATGTRLAPWDPAAGPGQCSVCRGTGQRTIVGSAPTGTLAEQWVGFSTDEWMRRNDSRFGPYIRPRYPLLDMGMSRTDCQHWLTNHGWTSVTKSACVGCPYHGNRMWRDMRENDPEAWADAVAFDHAIRNSPGLDGQRFLHASRVPLDIAPIDHVTRTERAKTQTDLLEHGDPDGCGPYACRSGSPAPEPATDQPEEVLPMPRDNPEPRTAWTAAELLATDFPEPRWAVPGLLAEGVTLLAGPPKVGKSWLSLGIALSVATGTPAVGRIDVQAGPVLYLALEDTPRRLQSRIRRMLPGVPNGLDGLTLVTACPTLADGGAERVSAWLTQHPGTRLVIIDVLAKIRGRSPAGASGYEADYAAIGALKSVADAYGVAFLVVHHVRKAGAEDFLDEVSGTSGIAGAADATLVLKRPRGSADGVLHITGRDVEEAEYPLKFDPGAGAWHMLDGPAGDYALSDTRATILRFLRGQPASTPKGIAAGTGLNYELVKKTCPRMADDGQLTADTAGRYSPRDTPTVPAVPGVPEPAFPQVNDGVSQGHPHQHVSLNPTASHPDTPAQEAA